MVLPAMDEAPLSPQNHWSVLVHRLTLDDAGLERPLCGRLDSVEKHLLAQAGNAADPRIAGLTRHLAAAGGKRLRPLPVLLGAEFDAPARPRAVQAAVITEPMHLSSLHHDDVMDEPPGGTASPASTPAGAPCSRRWPATWATRPSPCTPRSPTSWWSVSRTS